jgi:hypothetical protein
LPSNEVEGGGEIRRNSLPPKKEDKMKLKYKRVKIDSKEVVKLQANGWRIINIDVYNGYVLFEK